MSAQDNYNKGGFIAFLFSIIFCLSFFAYIAFIHPGVDLQEVEQQAADQAEAVLAGAGVGTKAVDVSGIEKPWLENPDMVAHGTTVYKNNCAVCHGNTGLGDGPAGAALVPKPRNLVEGGWKKGGTSVALYTTLEKGIEGTSMASFAHLSVVDRWALVQYMRSITKDKPADDPAQLEDFAKTAK